MEPHLTYRLALPLDDGSTAEAEVFQTSDYDPSTIRIVLPPEAQSKYEVRRVPTEFVFQKPCPQSAFGHGGPMKIEIDRDDLVNLLEAAYEYSDIVHADRCAHSKEITFGCPIHDYRILKVESMLKELKCL